MSQHGDPLKNAVKQGWVHLGGIHGMPENKKRTGYAKFKSWRQGRQAAKRGESAASCPFQLTEDVIDLLLKRDRWFRGYESYPKLARAVHKRISRERKDQRLKEKAERKKRKRIRVETEE
jgi:hypothetical protein